VLCAAFRHLEFSVVSSQPHWINCSDASRQAATKRPDHCRTLFMFSSFVLSFSHANAVSHKAETSRGACDQVSLPRLRPTGRDSCSAVRLGRLRYLPLSALPQLSTASLRKCRQWRGRCRGGVGRSVVMLDASREQRRLPENLNQIGRTNNRTCMQSQRWTFFAAVGAVIAGLIAEGLSLLH
jgi:hypothetical protein